MNNNYDIKHTANGLGFVLNTQYFKKSFFIVFCVAGGGLAFVP